MHHLAIDLGSQKSQICLRDPSGRVVEAKSLKTRSLGGYLKKAPSSRVIVETCAEAFHVADQALEAGHEVRVVPATLVRSLGVGARGIKTDERDAAVLSEVSCRIDLPSVHVPSASARQHKAISGSRARLVAARTMQINHVRGWLRQKAVTIHGRYAPSFTEKVRACGRTHVELPAHIERTLEVIDHLTAQIHSADMELKELTSSELHQRLQSVPGVGPVTACRFVASVDSPDRFPNAHRLQSYVGLTAGESSSGKKRIRTGITKAGAVELRAALVQAAWCALNSSKHRNDPMLLWAQRIKERRGAHIAVVALARKLVGILLALWKRGGSYDPTRGAGKSIG